MSMFTFTYAYSKVKIMAAAASGGEEYRGTAQKVVNEERGDCSEQREGYTKGMRMSAVDK